MMRNKEAATTLIFLRHGATDFPEERYYCDALEDPPLNKTGLTQAPVWIEAFKSKSFAAGYVSPSRRTRETAKLATAGLGLFLETLDGLRERSFGAWDGLTTDEIKGRFSSEWSAWKKDFLNFKPTGGESLAEFNKRVDQTIQGILSRHAGETVLVVTHVGPIRMIVANALGVPLENVKRLVVGSCSATQIEYTESWPNLVYFSVRPEFFD